MSELELRAGKFIGARVKRVEDPRYLTGKARYLADLVRAGELHCAFVRSTQPHARITGIEVEGALAVEGVVEVVTAETLPTEPMTDMLPLLEAKTPQPNLAVEVVRYVGEPIAAVVAESRAIAEDAADLVMVRYEPLEPVVDSLAALEPDAPMLFEFLESNALYRGEKEVGDVEAAFASAAYVFERRFAVNRYMAAPMETRGCVAEYDGGSGRLTLWSSTQTPHLLRLQLGGALGFPTQRIRVITPEVGGGFGQKMVAYPEEVVVCGLARKLGRPVKWVEDRRENLLAATHAKQQTIDIAIALDDDGTIRGIKGRYVGDTGAYSHNSGSALIEPHMPVSLLPNVYRVTDLRGEVVASLTNKTPIGPYRAVGWTAGHLAREVLLDEAARSLGLDPSELRLRNMLASDELPYRSPMGPVYDSGSYAESLEAVREMLREQYEQSRAKATENPELRAGLAIIPWVEPSGYGSEVAMQTDYPLASHDNARVSMDATGKVFASIAIPSQGQGHETTFAQVIADALSVPIEDVTVSLGDTDIDAFGQGTYSSRGAVVASGALGLAAADVRQKLLEVAGRLLEAAPFDLEIEDGMIRVVGAPNAAVPVAAAAGAAYFAPGLRDAESPELASTRFYDPRATYSNGSVGVVVEVDTETGMVEVVAAAAVEDCGTVLNPTVVEGQVRGAIAQGIGGALLEELVYESDGQLVTTTYMDYLLPTASLVPHIEVGHLESPSPMTMGGVKGMGESGLIATPAAVVAAVENALGVTFDRFPLTPERVLRSIRELAD